MMARNTEVVSPLIARSHIRRLWLSKINPGDNLVAFTYYKYNLNICENDRNWQLYYCICLSIYIHVFFYCSQIFVNLFTIDTKRCIFEYFILFIATMRILLGYEVSYSWTWLSFGTNCMANVIHLWFGYEITSITTII